MKGLNIRASYEWSKKLARLSMNFYFKKINIAALFLYLLQEVILLNENKISLMLSTYNP